MTRLHRRIAADRSVSQAVFVESVEIVGEKFLPPSDDVALVGIRRPASKRLRPQQRKHRSCKTAVRNCWSLGLPWIIFRRSVGIPRSV